MRPEGVAPTPAPVARDERGDPSRGLREEGRAAANPDLANALREEKTPETTREAAEELARARERLERDADRRIELERRAILRDFIDILDDLDRTLAAAGRSTIDDGLRMVHRRFVDKLERHGARRVEVAIGEPFDPEAQEAIATVPAAPRDAGKVVEVLCPAYFVQDELLRPAQVVVGRGGA